jgi:hypothetical protein
MNGRLQDYYKTQGLAMIESDVPGFVRGAAQEGGHRAIRGTRDRRSVRRDTERINGSVLVDRLLLCRPGRDCAGSGEPAPGGRQSWIRGTVPCVVPSVGIATALYIAPYVVGFAYHRHVIPLIWALLIIGSSALAHLHFQRSAEESGSQSSRTTY